MSESWDVIIAGGGAAGLSAALTLGRARRRVLVVDAAEPRNRFASHMHGVLGHDGLAPEELLGRGRKEMQAYDVAVHRDTLVDVRDDGDTLAATLADGTTQSARALIVATGLTDVLPDVTDLAERWGIDVLHCPYCHGWEVRDQRLAVLGTSPLSLHQAELLRQWSDHLVFLTAGCGEIAADARHRLQSRGVELVDTPVDEILTEGDRLVGVRLADGARLDLDAIFTMSSPLPQDEFLAALDLARAESPFGSFLAVDANGATSHPRVWAIGNVVNPGANVAISVGAGSLTAGVVNMALVSEEFDAADSPAGYWQAQYADRPRWSGRVNATTADVVATLPAGEVLDLGCGEGGDALWLAEHGWSVTAVDISATAVARGADEAAARGVADRISWAAHDLSTWTTGASFDLVTASFFHSTVELPRTEILRRAADRIRPGGHLLLVSHVFESANDVPPWARRHHQDDDAHPVMPTPDEEIAELALDPGDWEVVMAETRDRLANGPDGHETATVKDGVVLLLRR